MSPMASNMEETPPPYFWCRFYFMVGMLAQLTHDPRSYKDCNPIDLVTALRRDLRPPECPQETYERLAYHVTTKTNRRPEMFPQITQSTSVYENVEALLRQELGLAADAPLQECAFIVGKILAALGFAYPVPSEPIDADSLFLCCQQLRQCIYNPANWPIANASSSYSFPNAEAVGYSQMHPNQSDPSTRSVVGQAQIAEYQKMLYSMDKDNWRKLKDSQA